MTKTTEPRDLQRLQGRVEATHDLIVRLDGALLFIIVLQFATVLLIVLL